MKLLQMIEESWRFNGWEDEKHYQEELTKTCVGRVVVEGGQEPAQEEDEMNDTGSFRVASDPHM